MVDITVYTIAYNGYGKFISKFVEAINNIEEKVELIISLGENHGADLEYLKRNKVNYIIGDTKNAGKLKNKAIDMVKTDWMLFIDIDDFPRRNVIKEINNEYKTCDGVALKYNAIYSKTHIVARQTPVITMKDIDNWRNYIPSGYLAMKKIVNGVKMRYEEIVCGDFQIMFLLLASGGLIKPTVNPCVDYLMRADSHCNISPWQERDELIKNIDASIPKYKKIYESNKKRGII